MGWGQVYKQTPTAALEETLSLNPASEETKPSTHAPGWLVGYLGDTQGRGQGTFIGGPGFGLELQVLERAENGMTRRGAASKWLGGVPKLHCGRDHSGQNGGWLAAPTFPCQAQWADASLSFLDLRAGGESHLFESFGGLWAWAGSQTDPPAPPSYPVIQQTAVFRAM